MTKFGANERCWCGSGLKFKRCHRGKAEKERVAPFEVVKHIKRATSFSDCLCPPGDKGACSGQIIKAHSLSKRAALEKIAELGHVTSFGKRMENLFFKNQLDFDKIGLREASTFTGFCGHHDNAIFAPLDNGDFLGTDEQTLLVAYRTTCREVYAKSNAVNMFTGFDRADDGVDLWRQMQIQEVLQGSRIANESGLRDICAHKTALDAVVSSKDFSSLRFANFKSDGVPIFAGTGGCSPYLDPAGKTIQRLDDLTAEVGIFNVSLIPHDNSTSISLCWLSKYDAILSVWADEFRKKDATLGTAIWYLLSQVENWFARPSAVAGFASAVKKSVVSLCGYGAMHHDFNQIMRDRKILEQVFPAPLYLVSSR